MEKELEKLAENFDDNASFNKDFTALCKALPSDRIENKKSIRGKETMSKQAKQFFIDFNKTGNDKLFRWKQDLLVFTIGSSIAKVAKVFAKCYCCQDLAVVRLDQTDV